MVSSTEKESVEKSRVISRLVEEGLQNKIDHASIKPVVVSPKECSLSYAPSVEKLPLGVDLLDSVLLTIPKKQIESVAWQIPIIVSTDLPTGRVLAAAAHSAAAFSCQAQAHGLVPLIDLRLRVVEAAKWKTTDWKKGGDLHFARWRAPKPSCFEIIRGPADLRAAINDQREVELSQSLAEEMTGIVLRIVASLVEMSVDFKHLVLSLSVDVDADTELVRTGTVEALLLASLAKTAALRELGALCLILPPGQAASNQKSLVEAARVVSPYPVVFAELREAMYSQQSHPAPAPADAYRAAAESLLAAGC